MTKREPRLLVLSALRLAPGQVIWDVGAGTGTVAVEAARLCPESSVWAVEESPAGVELIAENSVRLTSNRVQVVPGRAPECLERLPCPHRIFVGGSGGNLELILETATARLMPGGIVVATALTLETLCVWHNFFSRRQGWQTWTWSLQASRLESVGSRQAWKAQNPVQIMAAERR